MKSQLQAFLVFTDGGSRGNPGPAAIGVYITKNGLPLYRFGKKIGIATNNVAEYTAVIEALDWLEKKVSGKDRENASVDIFLDSQLVVLQINRVYKIKNQTLKKLLMQIWEKETSLKIPCRYTHIPREKNKMADALVNEALDKP